jgi:hypothetical protein
VSHIHISTQELAMRWSVSQSSLQSWRAQGIGPVFLKIQNRVVYREEDVIAYEAQCLRKSTSESVGGAL